ncbi:hypothetical protein FF1_034010 [Malus domestica]
MAQQPTAYETLTAQQPSSKQVVAAQQLPAEPEMMGDMTPSQLDPTVAKETVHADSSLNNSHNQLSSTPNRPPLCSLP